MKRRRWLVLLLVAVVGAYFMYQRQPAADPKQPYAGLDTVLADDLKKGWTVAVPPKREGPYRRVSDVLAGGSHRVRGRDGVVEEINLPESAEVAQKVVELETRDGNLTLVGLKKPR